MYTEGTAVQYRTHQDEHKRPGDRMWWPAVYVRRSTLRGQHVIQIAEIGCTPTCQVERGDLRVAKDQD